MATRPNPAKTGQSAPKYGDLLKRGIFLLLALVVYRIGAHIPVPGIDPDQLSKLFQSQAGGILGMFNLFSGGALSRFTVFALGIMPYISASIVMQLLTMVSAQLEALKKEGQAGQRKITQYTRYFTLALATFQAFGIAMALEKQAGLVIDPGIMFRLMTVLTLVTGTMFLMWLGEQITERGLGNGISIIIFAGIAAGLPNAIGGLFELVRTHSMSIISALLIIVLVAAVTYLVVFIERGQRKILVNYAKRQVGNKMYGGQSSHLPLKLNMAGVIPPIFASSIILFPATIASWFSAGAGTRWLQHIATLLAPGQPPYVILYALAIVFFCFFYTALVFNSRETADNLKKSGAFVPGIRPGEQTARYIDKILTRLTLAGAIYIVFVCLLPEFLVLRWNVPFYFGGTSLLIIVVVTMDFMEQARSYLMSQQYESLLRKANFKGGKFPVR
ncbi:preprotein translocase subunit SecY [Candidatus Glomeribacter gigasporarum]|uniref:preprotein translocase subunit SecY n=1 Tax=Candidatus Glomeribacter gigasporarum TaxID=132144 RepID=UPI0003078448|nr:preprotein translocase subunit SecY [Candidatus Glomeribacter gigasporarum]